MSTGHFPDVTCNIEIVPLAMAIGMWEKMPQVTWSVVVGESESRSNVLKILRPSLMSGLVKYNFKKQVQPLQLIEHLFTDARNKVKAWV